MAVMNEILRLYPPAYITARGIDRNRRPRRLRNSSRHHNYFFAVGGAPRSRVFTTTRTRFARNAGSKGLHDRLPAERGVIRLSDPVRAAASAGACRATGSRNRGRHAFRAAFTVSAWLHGPSGRNRAASHAPCGPRHGIRMTLHAPENGREPTSIALAAFVASATRQLFALSPSPHLHSTGHRHRVRLRPLHLSLHWRQLGSSS